MWMSCEFCVGSPDGPLSGTKPCTSPTGATSRFSAFVRRTVSCALGGDTNGDTPDGNGVGLPPTRLLLPTTLLAWTAANESTPGTTGKPGDPYVGPLNGAGFTIVVPVES